MHCTGPSSWLDGLPLDNSASARPSAEGPLAGVQFGAVGIGHVCAVLGEHLFCLPVVRVPRRRGAGPAIGEMRGTSRCRRALLDGGRSHSQEQLLTPLPAFNFSHAGGRGYNVYFKRLNSNFPAHLFSPSSKAFFLIYSHSLTPRHTHKARGWM